ncbi:phage tail tape measure protein [Cellulosimicrobium sp. SH8]|uniref:phage tail tape measure protein n=1 Tax=Cellulosimicrobium sp. SH8 TaxID=2952936 RepID=UPI0021F29E35|nr:phage tail tape measure protein [Cellulosimicrobium sp. SH8]
MAGDVTWIDVLPAMDTFAKELATGTTKAATAAGKSSGLAWAKGFDGTAKNGAAKSAADELEAASKRTKKIVDDQTQAIAKARASERDAAAKVLLAEQALTDARQKGGEDSARAQAAELRLESARERQRAAAAKATSVEDQLVAAQREHREVTRQLDKATSDLNNEVDEQPGKWGAVKSSVAQAKDSFNEATGGVGGLVAGLAAAAGGAALFGEAWAQNMELDAGVDKVAASLDLTAAQSATAGQVAGALYADAYGESLTEVSGAVGTVMSSIAGMRDASEADLESVTRKALDFAQAFDVDVAESTRNAGILIQTGLATDAVHAFDLMTASLQRVPEALRGEVVDATQEYSQYFAQLGLTGEQSMSMLVAASANGQYAIDKTGDALKELTIRATDMSTASVSAYELAGLSAEDMSAKFLAGGDVASGALSELVTGLQGISDPTDKANAAIALFGTPLEDIGTDKIPAFLDSLSATSAELGDVTGKAEAMGDTLNGNASTGWERLKRGFVDVLVDGVQPLLGPAESILGWVQENPAALQVFAIALGALATAWGVYTAAQWAANSAMLASPMTWIVAGVVAVGAAIWALVENWDSVVAWFKDIWEPIGNWFGDLWQGILDAVQPVVDWFQASVLPVFSAVWDGIKAGGEFLWTALQVVFVSILTAWQLLADGFSWVWETFLSPVWEAVKVGAQIMWAWLDEHVFLPMRVGWELLGQGFAWVKDNVLVPVWNTLLQAGVNAWNWLDRWVFQPIKLGWQLVGDGFRWVKDNVITPVWNGVQTVLKTGWDWINTWVFSPIKTGVEAVGTVFQKTKDVISAAWDKVKAAAAAPVNFIIETVYTNGIKKTWDSIASKVGLDLKLPVVNPIKFATGGVMPGYTPGRDVHRFVSPTGGLLELSGGEAIMRPEWTRAVGGPAAVERMNAAARTGQAFANGGVWGNITGWAGDVWDGVARGASAAWNWAGDAAESVAKFLKDPVGALADLITKPMNAVLGGIGAGDLGTIVSELPRKAVSGLVETVKGLVSRKNEETAAAAAPAAGALGWQRMAGIVKDLLPWARITSTFRPGAITATGFPSMHGQGRAVDIAGVGSMDTVGMTRIFQTLKAAYPGSYELIYSPMGAQQLYKGRSHVFPEPTKGMHYNHVHWALANGGVLPLEFDEGGWLPPGPSVVVNNTGKPEPLARVDVAPSWGGNNTNVGGTSRTKVRLVVGGREFEAYLEEVADGRISEAQARGRGRRGYQP